MPIETHELDAIKQAAANAAVQATLALGAAPHDAGSVGMAVLEAIDKAAADPTDPTDPRPFAPGVRVRVKASGAPATVVRAIEEAGEVHTVVVNLDGWPGEYPLGPHELEVLA